MIIMVTNIIFRITRHNVINIVRQPQLEHCIASWVLNLVAFIMNTDEKLCLQWNDFRENVSSAFGDLRQDQKFADVTLACEDGQQVEAHKVILVASSPFLLNILKRTNILIR